MKQIQQKTAKRPSRPGSARHKARQQVRAARPLHKRLLVHPFTVMVLLCAGVLIVGTTWRGFAAPALDVTATVPAELPASAATIVSPSPQQHFSSPTATVIGDCPAQSYVKLYRNAAFSGVSQCTANTYQIQTSLTQGSNQLEAQVYNLTDQAGPAGAPLTVYYDEVTQATPPVPAETPVTVSVADVEATGYKQGAVPQSSANPTVSGWAPPRSIVTVTFHSNPLTCVTRADDSGWWSCTLSTALPPGVHHVDIVAVTPSGQTIAFPSFQIRVAAGLPSLLKPVPSGEPLTLRADYHYQVHFGHQSTDLAVGLTGGTLPYHVTADWGDGATTALDRTDTSPFTLSHTYQAAKGANKNYVVLVHATGAQGETSLLQLSVTVKGDGVLLLANTTGLNNLLDEVHRWLWLIWPTYVVVVLMAIGYYLGEREEYQR
ncbi:MAG TPA: hypothetical protein VF466_05690, partial [Candidatus Saccharimonadales bacterium]